MEKINLRAKFEKSGRAVFISHLDLMRTMQRALKRSKIPVWYTQGFNPHIYLNFPLALSLGVAGSTEFMDFAVTETPDFEDIKNRLSGVMPDGLRILDIDKPVCENKEIGFAEYIIYMYGEAEALLRELDRMLAECKIEVEKHSKSKGSIRVDIKPHIDIISKEAAGETLRVCIRLPAGQGLNINVNIFTDAFSEFSSIKPDRICAERTKILCSDGSIFR